VNNKKPIIAAVDGAAVGMGVTMVLHCDYVLAGTTASFLYPFAKFGLVPQGGASLLVPWMAGHQRAFSLLVLGRPMDAAEAREAGLVNAVVAPGHAVVEAQKVAREICALPSEAVALSRKLLKPPTEEVLRRMDQEQHLFGERQHTASVVAAVESFFQRRHR
jgi:enoyl-CoA hydratase/carnithine racemase